MKFPIFQRALLYRRLKEKWEDNEEFRQYTKEAHSGHFRKASGASYSDHPLSVEKILDAYGAPDVVIRAGLAHDILEDEEKKGYSEEKIENDWGEEVAQLVLEVSNIPSLVDLYGKKVYMSNKLINMPEKPLWIKLSDVLANSTDNPTKDQKDRMRKNIIDMIRHRQKLPKGNLKELLKSICMVLDINYSNEVKNR